MTVWVLTFVYGLYDTSDDLIQPKSLFKDILYLYMWLVKKM